MLFSGALASCNFWRIWRTAAKQDFGSGLRTQAESGIAADESQFGVHQSFPGLGLGREIFLQVFGRDDKFSVTSSRAETRIYRKNHSLLGVGGECLNQLLDGACKEFAILRFVADKQQIGIGEQIKFAAAEPAERENRQPLRRSGDAESRSQCVLSS